MHSLESRFQNLAFEVGHRFQCVGVLACGAVLQHKHTVAVVGIHKRESVGRESVEEHFLRVAVVGKRFMVVQVVLRQVREDCARELQSGNAALVCGVRTNFHKAVVTANLDHFGQQAMQLQRVGCCLGCLNGFCAHNVANRRQQTGLVAELCGHTVQQSHGCCLAVGAGDAHQFQFFRRPSVPVRRQLPEGCRRIFHHGESHALTAFGRNFLANHNRYAAVNGLTNKVVSVDVCAANRYKQPAFGRFARIVGDACHASRFLANPFGYPDTFKQCVNVHHDSVKIILSPFLKTSPARNDCCVTIPRPTIDTDIPAFSRMKIASFAPIPIT